MGRAPRSSRFLFPRTQPFHHRTPLCSAGLFTGNADDPANRGNRRAYETDKQKRQNAELTVGKSGGKRYQQGIDPPGQSTGDKPVLPVEARGGKSRSCCPDKPRCCGGNRHEPCGIAAFCKHGAENKQQYKRGTDPDSGTDKRVFQHISVHCSPSRKPADGKSRRTSFCYNDMRRLCRLCCFRRVRLISRALRPHP